MTFRVSLLLWKLSFSCISLLLFQSLGCHAARPNHPYTIAGSANPPHQCCLSEIFLSLFLRRLSQSRNEREFDLFATSSSEKFSLPCNTEWIQSRGAETIAIITSQWLIRVISTALFSMVFIANFTSAGHLWASTLQRLRPTEKVENSPSAKHKLVLHMMRVPKAEKFDGRKSNT